MPGVLEGRITKQSTGVIRPFVGTVTRGRDGRNIIYLLYRTETGNVSNIMLISQ